MTDILHAAGLCPCHDHAREAVVAGTGFAGLLLVLRYWYYAAKGWAKGVR